MLAIQLQLNAQPLIARLTHLRERLVPTLRRQLARRIARDVLRRTIQLNPVDTARARSAWVHPLEQIEPATAPAGWKGPHPDPAAIREGEQLGRLQHIETRTTTELRIRNAVPYITFLERGTRRTRAYRMVEQALREIAAKAK